MNVWIKNNYLALIFFFIISIIFVADLFYREGRPVTFDGPTHIANIAQVYQGLKEGIFPVRWGEGWARYGWPAPIFSQQVTTYFGALVNFLFKDLYLSYNFIVFIGTFLSSILLYIFLRFYVGFYPAIAATFIFHFAPYRIMNVYIRGALPEFWASVFIILTLISLHMALYERKFYGFILLSLSTGFLLLTHPFMFIVSIFLFLPYVTWLLYRNKKYFIGQSFILFVMTGLGFGIASYFLLPLFLEIKYLYYGSTNNHFATGHFLSMKNFFTEAWPYFTKNDIGPRGHYHIGGLFEGVLLLISSIVILLKTAKNHSSHTLFIIMTIVSWVYILFMLQLSEFIYKNFSVLGNIQHPWRMMTGYIIAVSISTGFLLNLVTVKKNLQAFILVVIVFVIGILRIPQLYGKNYTLYPEKNYFITDDNMHGTQMNTVWMGEVRDYPYKKNKIEIIEGQGKIIDLKVGNSYREYKINAKTDVNIVDYTFYFPGWKVYVDGNIKDIQFQDPNYRGVITYQISEGSFSVFSRFERTKPRIFGETFSVVSIFFLIALALLGKRIPKFLQYGNCK